MDIFWDNMNENDGVFIMIWYVRSDINEKKNKL